MGGVPRPRSLTRAVAYGAAFIVLIGSMYALFAPPPTLRDLSRHGRDMVGKTIQVHWADRDEWYKARVTKYNVATPHDLKLEGTHTIVYEDGSVQHAHLHEIRFQVVYGKELIGHSISIYRSGFGMAKIANVTSYDERQQAHTLRFDDGGMSAENLALAEFEVIYGFELVGRILLIAREFRDDPIYASVLHYSEYKGTFVLGFADGSVETVDLKGVTFELVHNQAEELQKLRESHAYSKELNLVREVDIIAESKGATEEEEAPVYRANRKRPSRADYEGDPLRGIMAEFVDEAATPGQVAILHQAKEHFDRGLQGNVKRHLDSPIAWFPCAHENGACEAVPYCATDNSIAVRFGHVDNKWVNKTFSLQRFPITCSSANFGTDPAVGKQKYCELLCDRGENEVRIVNQCSQTTLPFVHEIANMPFCQDTAAHEKLGPEEQVMQSSIQPFCESPKHRPGMVMQLDCQFQKAYHRFAVESDWNGVAKHSDWFDRAWVTFFAGSASGPHAGMVTNLIRSIHMFSKYPVIVFAVDTTALTADWNPETFPNLVVVHTNSISNMNNKQPGVSFNFNKFRSMLLRIKVGIQLDADMIMAKHCDRLFDATETHITARYPYPIMPVHWMTRMKGADGYSNAYPVEYDGFRIRWAHAHPTWTYHALPFMADALLAKLNIDEWAAQIRRETGKAVVPIPPRFFSEDEDLLNVLLWRNNATKQWCKWDVEPALFEDFLGLSTNQPTYSDTVWYKSGIPLVFIGMHNTKDPIATDKLLGRLRREGSADNYVFHAGTYFSNPFDVEKQSDVFCLSI